jgi:hypothetical protein
MLSVIASENALHGDTRTEALPITEEGTEETIGSREMVFFTALIR